MTALLAQLVDLVCTFNEAFWLWRYIDLLYERRKMRGILEREKWLLPGIQMGCFMIIVMVMNKLVQLVSPYTIHILFVQSMAAACIFWKCNIWDGAAIAGGYLFALTAVGVTEVSLTGVLGEDVLIRQTTAETGWIRVVYLCILGPIWCGINCVVYGLLKKKNVNTASLKYLACLSVTGLLGFTNIILQMLSNFDVQINIVWYVFLFSIALGIFGGYYKIKSQQIQERMRMLDDQNRMLESKYGEISALYHENARNYHDFSHHLTAILHMIEKGKDDEVKQYIISLRNLPQSVTVKIRTGIDVVDVILSEMERKAADKGIAVAIHSQMLPEKLPIEKRDLCALLANLLENAMEAAEKEINVVLKSVNSMLLIQIQNDYRVEPIWMDGRLRSLKPDAAHHGWGTQSIEYVVKKYHGSVEYKSEEGRFCVDIMLYI